MLKNITFELLDHHHELNQKKLILLKFFMLKTDSTMLELWSIPVKSCIFYIFLTFVESWLYIFCGSGRCRGRYNRSNVFVRTLFWEKMTLKKWCYFLKIICFSICSGSMLTRTAPFLRSISMWKRLNLNFLDKCGWYILFLT